ncbi:hypothetical protein [Desulfoluna sp.]|uniref:hypothetical protein n=1 Tax=Desulfoluna sp. TaxID=2045199 RepID=UPI0026186242|nr:hypothetical protein [Desulfoluna sp.]
MTPLDEGRLTFTFSGDSLATQYDDWTFYKSHIQSAWGGCKAIDFICVHQRQTWLIEVKDYRIDRRTKILDFGDEIALKVRDTLAGLAAARCNANDADERRMAGEALQCKKLRVVLHLEQPRNPSKLFPQVIDPSKMTQKLKQKLKAVDAHPRVVDKHSLKSNPDMCWSVDESSSYKH